MVDRKVFGKRPESECRLSQNWGGTGWKQQEGQSRVLGLECEGWKGLNRVYKPHFGRNVWIQKRDKEKREGERERQIRG